MQNSTMKRRALSDSALPDDWSFGGGALVSDVINRIENQANRGPQQDMSLTYATTEQLDRQNECIGVLASQVTALNVAQQHSNDTANALVIKITSMMEALDRSTQQLGLEAQRQAEKTKVHDENFQNVHGIQEQWWNHNELLAEGQMRHQNELWNQYQRLCGINQWQEQVNATVNANVPTDHGGTQSFSERRRSAPDQYSRDEEMPPPRRVTMPEYTPGMPSTVVYSQISDPPIFDESRYEDWKKAIQWWQEINAGTDANRLLATLGMCAKGSMKIVLQEYFDTTKLCKSTRSIDSFVSLMDEKFRRPTEELILLRVEQWNEMKRKPSEGFKSFWIRLERLQQKLADLGIVWPVKVAFQKAFTSLGMNREQQTLTRAALEMTNDADSTRELKRITVKLFDNQSQEVDEVCAVDESSDAEESENPAQEWELQPARATAAKSRGGSLHKSIKSTQNLYGFKGNTKGTGKADQDSKCRNCSQSGHWWRNCPNLLKKPVIFNRAKGGSKKGGKKPSGTTSMSKGASHNNVVNEEDATHVNQDYEEEEYDDTLEVVEDSARNGEELDETLDDFYAQGQPWNETFVLYDVMETSTAWQCIDNSEKKLMHGMIDSGASATVCGMSWYQQWKQSCSGQAIDSSTKQFRFGDGRVVKSLGCTTLSIKIIDDSGKVATIRLYTDIVPGNVPLLISYGSLHRAKCVLDFHKNKLWMNQFSINLKVTPRGHIYLPIEASQEEFSTQTILHVSRDSDKQEIHTSDQNKFDLTKLHRLHVHLGHASPHTMMRVILQAKGSVKMEDLIRAVNSCGCDQLKFGFQRPLVHSNKPLKCGSHVALDVFYPVSNTNMRIPYLLMICMLSRFVLAAALDSHRPKDVLEIFFCHWCMSMGKPTRIISDRSKTFMGPEWNQFLSAFAIEHVMTSAKSQHENGLAERAISLIKTAFESMRKMCPELSNNRLVSWACMIKNLTPMLGSGVSPAQVMLGRNNLLESLENAQWIEPSRNVDVEHTMQFQIQAALQARTAVIVEDAKRVVDLGMNRQIRAGTKHDVKVGDTVQLFLKDEELQVERWTSGFKIIGVTSHHVLVERGEKLFKHPKYKTRPVCESIPTGNQDDNKKEMPSSSSKSEAVYQEFASSRWIASASTNNENSFENTEIRVNPSRNLEDLREMEILSGADINRITPRFFLKCPRALDSIKKELLGLLKVHNGQAALELITNHDDRWKRNRRIHSLIITKRKTTSEFKARLVLRGDTVSEQDTAFASAPTACRGSVHTLLMLNVTFNLAVYMVDISQAFLQADEMAASDKLITSVPPYVILPDPKKLPRCKDSGMPLVGENDIKILSFDEYQALPIEDKRSTFKRCLVTHRPLYGGRDAPLRWFLRLASALRQGGWRNTRSDVCTFTRHARDKNEEVEKLTSIIIVHVDDLLISANLEDISRLRRVLSQFNTGPIFELNKEKHLEYLGLELQLNSRGQIGLHQMKYINALQLVSIEDVIKNQAWIITPERWKTLMRQLVGSLIWLGQTRFDIIAVTTVMSTTMVSAMQSMDKALYVLKLYNKTVKMLKSNQDIIWYRNFWHGPTPSVQTLLGNCSIFTFTDAGFGCLEGSFSTQAVVIGFGLAKKKDTMIAVQGCLLWCQARKIHRIARSSLACEVLSISDGIDLSIWYQQYLFELLTGQFHKDSLSPTDTLPLVNPFLFGKTNTNLSGVSNASRVKEINEMSEKWDLPDAHNLNVMVTRPDMEATKDNLTICKEDSSCSENMKISPYQRKAVSRVHKKTDRFHPGMSDPAMWHQNHTNQAESNRSASSQLGEHLHQQNGSIVRRSDIFLLRPLDDAEARDATVMTKLQSLPKQNQEHKYDRDTGFLCQYGQRKSSPGVSDPFVSKEHVDLKSQSTPMHLQEQEHYSTDRFLFDIRKPMEQHSNVTSKKMQDDSAVYTWYVHYSNDRFSSVPDLWMAECAPESNRKDQDDKNKKGLDLIAHCNLCGTNNLLNVNQLAAVYNDIMFVDPIRRRVKSIVFTDCANAYSSVGSITAGSADKSMRLHLAYIRDNAITNILSFCDAIFNLADLGTKLNASAVNWRKFLQLGTFHVSFVGRKASLALFKEDEKMRENE